MIRRKPYIFGANQNRNRLNLSVAKYITHWFQRKLTAPIRPLVKRLNKPFGGPDRFPALPMIDKCIGEKDICDMWQAHYKNLLNSVDTSKSKEFVKQKLKSITDYSIAFSPVDIFNALKNTTTGKACGVDGLAAEHFIYANPIIHVYLSLLFDCFIYMVICLEIL